MKRFGVAAESAADAGLVASLADRLLIAEIDWLDGILEVSREWVGTGGERWLDLHTAYARARERGLRVYGHFRGEPSAMDAQMHRAALLLFAEDAQAPDAVVLARDMDGALERAKGLKQAIEEREWPFTVVPALAIQEIEAWQVAAWRPSSAVDEAALETVRARVGFDPIVRPDRLTSKRQSDPKDAKRALGELCGAGPSEHDRWADFELALVATDAAQVCGLADFAADVRAKLAPVLRHPPRRDPPSP